MNDIVLGIRLTADGKDLVGAVRVSTDEVKKMTEAVKQSSSEAEKLNNQNKNLGQTLGAAANRIGLYSAAWGKATDMIARSAGAVAGYIRDSAMLNARFEELGIVMKVVGNNAGYTSAQMEGAAVGMRKLGISMLESRNATIQLAQAQIPLAAATKLADAARNTAVIGMTNTSDALQRMIYGIKSGQTDILRTLGLNVNFEQSYRALAAQMHVNVNALSEHDKMLARSNATTEEAARASGTYEAAMTSAAKQMRSMVRYTEDLKIMRGEVFNEALTVAVMAYVDQLHGANQATTELANNGKLKDWGKDIADTLAFMADSVMGMTAGFRLLGVSIGEVAAIAAHPLSAFDIHAWAENDRDAIAKSVSMFRDALAERRRTQQADADQRAQIETKYLADVLVVQKAYAGYSVEIQRKAMLALAQSTGLEFSGKLGAPTPQPGLEGKPKTADPYRQLLESLRKKLLLDKQSTEVEQLNAELQEKKYAKLTPLQRLELTLLAQANDLKALDALKSKAAIDYAEQYGHAEDRRAQALADYGTTFEAHLQDIKTETDLMGKTEIAREKELDLLKLKKQWLDILGKTDEYDVAAVTRINAEYDRQRQALSDTLDRRGAAKAMQKQIEETRTAAKKMNEDLQRGLTDSIFRGFEAGKGFAENFRDSLVNMFKTTILRPVIQWVVSPLTGAATAALGSLGIPGLANAAGGGGGIGDMLGMASNASSLFGGGGLLGSAGAYSLATGAGASQAAMLAAQTGVFGAAGTAATAGAGAAGVGAASAIPYVGWAIAAYAALDSMGVFGGGGGGPASFTGIDVNANLSKGGFAGQLFGTSKNTEDSFRWPTFMPGNLQETANAAVTAAFTQVSKLGTILGVDPSVLAGVSANVSFRSASHDAAVITQDLINNLGALTDQMALKLMPNIKDFAHANETLTQTLVRLAQAKQQADVKDIFSQMDAAIKLGDQMLDAAIKLGDKMRDAAARLADQTRDLWLSDLSPLTNAQRLAQASGLYGQQLAAAQGGDLAALGNLSGTSRGYLQEARGYYASSQSYTDIFNQVQGQIGGLVSKVQGDAVSLVEKAQFDATSLINTALTEQSIRFSEMGISLADINVNIKDLDKRIADAVNNATAAWKSTQDAIRDAAEQIVRSAQQTTSAVTESAKETALVLESADSARPRGTRRGRRDDAD